MSQKIRFFSVVMAFVTFVCFVFNGCSVMDAFDSGMEGLMQPPMPDKEKYRIKLLLDTLVKGTVILSSPKSGTFTTACVEYDVDGDQVDEAVIFYQEKLNGVTELYIHLFRKVGNSWESAERLLANGDDVFSLNFFDLNSDGVDEIIVMWENTDTQQTSKTLAVYEYANNAISLGVTKECEDVTVVDLKEGGNPEIITLTLEITETASVAKAEVYEYSESIFQRLGEVKLNSEIIGYANITSSSRKGKEYFPRVMVDSFYQNYQQLMTDIIYWNVETDKLSTYTLPYELITRKSTITSCDIDGDGVVDLPTLISFANTVNEDAVGIIDEKYATREHMVAWHTYYRSSHYNDWFTSKHTVLNSEFNYILTIPKEWVSDIAFEDKSTQNEYVFYKWDNEKNQRLGVYVKVRVFKAAYWEENKYILTNRLNYTKIKTNRAGTLVYAFGKGDYGLPDDLVLSINE